MTGTKEFFQNLVADGVVSQEPVNYDAATLKMYIAHLEAENAELKSSLTHANEECLKWHERAQNLLKDSGGSISEYEKKISDLQAENAELRARLEKAVEEVDKVKKIIDPTMYTSFCGFVVRWCTLVEHKELYGTQEAAESKLKELKENV